MPYRHVLISTDDSDAADFTLPEGETLAGRSGRCDLVISSIDVSRIHAVIRVKGKDCTITNRGRGGTYLNGKIIEGPEKLRRGDGIGIMGNTFRYELMEDPAKVRVGSSVPDPDDDVHCGGVAGSENVFRDRTIAMDCREIEMLTSYQSRRRKLRIGAVCVCSGLLILGILGAGFRTFGRNPFRAVSLVSYTMPDSSFSIALHPELLDNILVDKSGTNGVLRVSSEINGRNFGVLGVMLVHCTDDSLWWYTNDEVMSVIVSRFHDEDWSYIGDMTESPMPPSGIVSAFEYESSGLKSGKIATTGRGLYWRIGTNLFFVEFEYSGPEAGTCVYDMLGSCEISDEKLEFTFFPPPSQHPSSLIAREREWRKAVSISARADNLWRRGEGRRSDFPRAMEYRVSALRAAVSSGRTGTEEYSEWVDRLVMMRESQRRNIDESLLKTDRFLSLGYIDSAMRELESAEMLLLPGEGGRYRRALFSRRGRMERLRHE